MHVRALSQFLLHIFLLSPAILAWSQFMKCHVFYFLDYWTMEKVQETSNSECYTPTSEPFRIYKKKTYQVSQCIDQDLNQAPPEYKSEVLPLEPAFRVIFLGSYVTGH
jgi:hypothetical protein